MDGVRDFLNQWSGLDGNVCVSYLMQPLAQWVCLVYSLLPNGRSLWEVPLLYSSLLIHTPIFETVALAQL